MVWGALVYLRSGGAFWPRGRVGRLMRRPPWPKVPPPHGTPALSLTARRGCQTPEAPLLDGTLCLRGASCGTRQRIPPSASTPLLYQKIKQNLKQNKTTSTSAPESPQKGTLKLGTQLEGHPDNLPRPPAPLPKPPHTGSHPGYPWPTRLRTEPGRRGRGGERSQGTTSRSTRDNDGSGQKTNRHKRRPSRGPRAN